MDGGQLGCDGVSSLFLCCLMGLVGGDCNNNRAAWFV